MASLLSLTGDSPPASAALPCENSAPDSGSLPDRIHHQGLFEKCQHAQRAALLPPYITGFPCNPPRILHRRIERLCRIIVHDPSVKRRMAALSALSPPQAGPRMGSLHDMDSCVKPASSGGKISHPWSYFYFSNSAYYFRTERSEVIYAMFCGCTACCGEQNGLN